MAKQVKRIGRYSNGGPRRQCCCHCGTRTLRGIFVLFIIMHLNLVRGEITQEEDYTLAYVNLTYFDPLSKQSQTSKEEMGKFSQGKVGEAAGILVHLKYRNGSVNYGCEKMMDPIPKESWIALIRRGVCSYARKISNAVQSNATAVVIYDDREGETVKMPNTGAGYKAIAIFISKDNGERIAELVDNGTKVYMYITVGTHQSVRYTNINRTSVLFVSISFIVLMIISLAWLIFYYVQRFRYINAKDQLARRLCSAAKKALSKIPLKTIKDTDAETECCAVCIEPYKVPDVVRILPCKHQFHKSCIDPWLLDQRTCPMCKMDILKFYGLVFAGSEESILQIDTEENTHRLNHEPESVALPSRNSSQTSQAVCSSTSGPLAAATLPSLRSHGGQDGQFKGLASAASGDPSSNNTFSHTFQPKTIDCIKITMLENSPMAARMLNRSKMADAGSDACSSPGSDVRVGPDYSIEPSEIPVLSCQELQEELRTTEPPSLELAGEKSPEVQIQKDLSEKEIEVSVPPSECATSSDSPNINNNINNNNKDNEDSAT